MLQCSSCGSNLRPTARICIKCGNAVTDDQRKQALQQDAALGAVTSMTPIYTAKPSQSNISQDSTQPEVEQGPIFSSPVDGMISQSFVAQKPVVGTSSSTIPGGISPQQKKMAAIVISAILIVGFAVGLSSIMGKKEEATSSAPAVALPAPIAPVAPAVEISSGQKVVSVIDLANIKLIMSPPQTSGLLTDMLLNNSNSVKLLELKAKIEEIYPKPDRGDRKTARALNEQALLAFRQENYQQAANIFTDAVKSDPADVEILNSYAFALFKLGRYVDAERALGFVLSIAPGRTSGWANLADVYANTSRPDAASAAFVVGFRFATNQDKALTFLKDRAESEPNENIRRAVINALAQLSQ
jgi:hypothetical protein